MMLRQFRLLSVFLFLAVDGWAAVVEDVIDVPVSVRSMYGQDVSQTIKVTVFRDDQRSQAPYLVLNHGRPPNEGDFSKMKRQRFPENSRYFVSKGFVVFVPTRVGYGESGGPDVEYSGKCDAKRFAPALNAAAQQTVAVIEYAKALPHVDVSRGLVVGQSFGGMMALTLATMDVAGLKGSINFAGGSGGNPVERPENPCSLGLLRDLFREYGATARVPTLWLYSENDKFWGPKLPMEWFVGYIQAGGFGKFVKLPAYKNDGHGIFTGEPAVWKPAFEEFLEEAGF